MLVEKILQAPDVAEPLQVVEVQRIGAPDGERNPVHDDGILLGDLVEDVPRAAAALIRTRI